MMNITEQKIKLGEIRKRKFKFCAWIRKKKFIKQDNATQRNIMVACNSLAIVSRKARPQLAGSLKETNLFTSLRFYSILCIQEDADGQDSLKEKRK